MQLAGAWPEALVEAAQACERLASQPAVGEALYRLGELHRLRGDFTAAEEAYNQAARYARRPRPGQAQLRLAQGQVATARTVILRSLDEAHDRLTRARLLAAAVEILLAAGDVGAARAAADELASLSSAIGAPLLAAASAHATGAVLLAEGDARSALASLRTAWMAWQDLDAPYDAARARVLIALACRKVGDRDACAIELDAARSVFQRLGAAPDVERVGALAGGSSRTPLDLTDREIQVLRLVAAGKTNRAIAGSLSISEKTVARHVSNIFSKLGLATRAAATAYAYEHRLV
jgi:DNA-binding CsgD family transcriptional regulator